MKKEEFDLPSRIVSESLVDMIIGIDGIVKFKQLETESFVLISKTNLASRYFTEDKKNLITMLQNQGEQHVRKMVNHNCSSIISEKVWNILKDYWINLITKDNMIYGEAKVEPLHIRTYSNVVPIHTKRMRWSYKERQMIRREVKKMLKLGIIRHSNSEWCSAFVLIPKQNKEV